MVWLLTGSGWLVIGAVSGWHVAEFVDQTHRPPGAVCALVGAVGGVAGGAAIAGFGVTAADPAWILSLLTCVVGAAGAVALLSAWTWLKHTIRGRS